MANRWARALHELATEKGALDEVRRDMQTLAGEVSTDKVREFLTAASVSSSEKERVLVPLLATFSKWTQNLVKLAIERRREAVLVGLPAAFQRCEDELSGVLQGHVECARELGKSEIAELEQAMQVRFGKKVVLQSRKNPDLIGGVRVFVGAKMIDQSIQGRLDSLARKMRSAPLT